MARLVDAEVIVVDMGVVGDLSSLSESGKIVSKPVAAGTANMVRGPAMTRDQALAAVEAGIQIAEDLGDRIDVFGTGDMGIGNTTPSTAIAAVLTGQPVSELAGGGTGIDDEQLGTKIRVIERSLDVNRPRVSDGLDVLAQYHPRAVPCSVVVAIQSRTHSLLSVLSIPVAVFNSNGANQPAYDRVINNSCGCRGNDDWNLSRHQSITEKRKLPSISWSCLRNHGLGQRHTSVEQGGNLPPTSRSSN